MAPLEIGYWKIRGLGAPLRMLCEYAGVEYTVQFSPLRSASRALTV